MVIIHNKDTRSLQMSTSFLYSHSIGGRRFEIGSEIESGAATGLTLHPDAPAHQVHDAGGDGQAQPRAAKLASGGGVRLRKSFKDHRLCFRHDSDSGIG